MRTTTIQVRGSELEIFIEKKEEGFEFWTVGVVKGKRQVLDHHLTHDDLEKRLHHQQHGDLLWQEAVRQQIPNDVHSCAKEMEKTIKRGSFIDRPSVAEHLGFGSIELLGGHKSVLNAAKAAIQGEWTDGKAAIVIAPDHNLSISGIDSGSHLNNGWPATHPVRDWWNFEAWRFCTMNREKKLGQVIAVIHVSDQELHFYSTKPDQIAHVFKRI